MNITKEQPMNGCSQILECFVDTANVGRMGGVLLFCKDYRLLFSKAISAITNVPRAKNSVQVMYI